MVLFPHTSIFPDLTQSSFTTSFDFLLFPKSFTGQNFDSGENE